MNFKTLLIGFLILALLVSGCVGGKTDNQGNGKTDSGNKAGNDSPNAGTNNASNNTSNAGSNEVQEFSLTAKNWEFSPSTITVKKGQKVRLKVTALDNGVGAGHGLLFESQELGVQGVNLPEGKEVTVEFTPTKAGEFPFRCSVFCGQDHSKMTGKVVVTE